MNKNAPKINKSHFSFKLVPCKITKTSWKQYMEILNKETKDNFDKNHIKTCREDIKKERLTLIVTHKLSKISKTFDVTSSKLDMKTRNAFITEVLAAVRSKRKESLKLVPNKREFAGAPYETVGGVFVKQVKGGVINEIAKKTTYNNPFTTKKPNSKLKNYIGVELEFNYGDVYGEKQIGGALKAAGVAKYVHVGTDASCGYEVRVLLEETNFVEPLTKILDVLVGMGFQANEKCGTHVHLDMRNRDVKQAYSNFFKTQSFMQSLLKKHRIGNTYSKSNVESTFDEHNSIGERRYGINTNAFKEHGTLEIRMHHGTLNKDELIPWINLLIKIANHKENANKMIGTLEDAVVEFKLDGWLKEALENKSKLLTALPVGATAN